ncbi:MULTISPECIES: phthiocerol/phthiodiolone dimycocerosyl transferase family protein [Nocardiaceae]|uniref:phthiocerol/phthiodiolone dimycocerosyl transferase family protein n=1 Tax=Nocardiaceae TaxID=85025 RepID=UPI00050C043B|nr:MULTISPECIES: hypothetical protein [Rhodococcus]AMY56247.1 Phthiocerol/phthiodiolone dimycocerosyl transferase [Rhodococcus fascians D188]OZC43757.1 hypothetical protein CH289_26515 [Rhodococcus sp. RS1C4]OZD10547.1 hypothetical protein CH281_00575 [Rhodococcus sp. 06-221-2]OZD16349.1 hypothetical protein CH280_08870 [Rhodococcus sp. 06-156-4C]OZD31056.1 hypothetical protein CH284_23395 [Rhodococcus sp. 06-156-3]
MTVDYSIRGLAPSEALYVDLGVFIGYSVRARGDLNISGLSAAFATLRRSYPVLAAHVETIDGDHMIVKPSGPLPGLSVHTGDPGQPLSGVNLSAGRALSGLHVVGDSACASVTLLTHHCIADGRHSVDLLSDLWSFYTDIVEGKTPDAVVHGYPESLEKLFSERGIDTPDVGNDEPLESALNRPPTAGYTEPHRAMTQLRCRLSRRVTTGLIDFGRHHGVTVNGLVSAAIMRTESDLRSVRLADIAYHFIVDLRPHVTPAVDSTAGTNIVGFPVYRATAESVEIVDLARSLNEELHIDLAAGHLQSEALTAAKMAVLLPEPNEVRCTNGGTVPPLRSPAGLKLEDCRPAPAGFSFPVYIVHGYGGRLNIEFALPHGASRYDIGRGRERIRTLESHLRSVA